MILCKGSRDWMLPGLNLLELLGVPSSKLIHWRSMASICIWEHEKEFDQEKRGITKLQVY